MSLLLMLGMIGMMMKHGPWYVYDGCYNGQATGDGSLLDGGLQEMLRYALDKPLRYSGLQWCQRLP
jgi:hypothetical protein